MRDKPPATADPQRSAPDNPQIARRPVSFAKLAAAVVGDTEMSNVTQLAQPGARIQPPRSRRQKRQQKEADRRPRKNQNISLDRLQKLVSQWWMPESCIRTNHALWRAEQRHITWHEFAATWRSGEWSHDENAPDYFIARLGDCELIVTFCEETPILVTAI